MAIFPDDEPHHAPRRSGGWAGRLLLLFAMVAIIAVALVPSPYVIQKPGPVFDTLGTVTVDGSDVPLIDIPVQQTYPTTGSLDMLTVSIEGNRDSTANWMAVALAWLDPSKAVVPLDSVYPAGVSVTESNEQSRVEMENSQHEAIAAALAELDYTYTSTLTIVDVTEGNPAAGILKPDDVIVSINGTPADDVTELRALIADNGTKTPAAVTISRGGVEQTLDITPELSDAEEPTPILGILVGSDYEFPFDVSIQLQNVGGPSAGQMFALGIIDKLTEGSLTGGKSMAGTGTITAAGDIGPIGGIRQKLYGAANAGAAYFLAPADNCDEVTGHIPEGLTVFAVATLDDSLAALDAVSSGSSTADLPACPVG